MISSFVSRASASYLGVLGLVMLFGADTILPLVIPSFPLSAVWLGQLIAGAWLALAAMNWQARNAILGGIYGRPVVYSNVLLFVVTALGVLKPALAAGASPLLWLIVGPAMIFALVYGALLLRGPFDALKQG
ncbi:MAG: hypothetical protein ABI852_05705 [Gemmatimonadaceae bacterium]